MNEDTMQNVLNTSVLKLNEFLNKYAQLPRTKSDIDLLDICVRNVFSTKQAYNYIRRIKNIIEAINPSGRSYCITMMVLTLKSLRDLGNYCDIEKPLMLLEILDDSVGGVDQEEFDKKFSKTIDIIKSVFVGDLMKLEDMVLQVSNAPRNDYRIFINELVPDTLIKINNDSKNESTYEKEDVLFHLLYSVSK